jgi:ketosteroid isomerase-like protein
VAAASLDTARPDTAPAAAAVDSGDLAERRAELVAAESTLSTVAARDGLAAGLKAAIADDALLLVDGEPVIAGRAAIHAHLARAGGERRVAWSTLRADVSSDGTHGYTFGRLAERATPADTAVHGRYLAYWTRGGDGWRLLVFLPRTGASAQDTVPAGFGTPPGGRLGAVRTPAPAESVLLDADAAFAARSVEAGVATAFAEYAAETAVIPTGRGGILWGPAAIRAYYTENVPPSDGLTWIPRIARVAPGGDFGFTIGDGTYRHVPAGGAPQHSYTKYLSVWRRQPDGSWRYLADMGNARPATTADEAAKR